MDKRVKFSYQEKLSVVRSVTSGQESNLGAATRLGSKKNTVARWVRLYREHGSQGLRLRKGSYDGAFKLRVVRYMLKNRLSLARTAVIFGISQDPIVGRWFKIYQQKGASGLLQETRGRKKSIMAKKKKKTGSPSDPVAKKMEDLQREVEYLRAENAFLKKLDALIQQEKTDKAQARSSKSSRN